MVLIGPNVWTIAAAARSRLVAGWDPHTLTSHRRYDVGRLLAIVVEKTQLVPVLGHRGDICPLPHINPLPPGLAGRWVVDHPRPNGNYYFLIVRVNGNRRFDARLLTWRVCHVSVLPRTRSDLRKT